MNGGRYNPWTDAYGVPITTAARVEQVGVDAAHGALARRMGKLGVIAGYGRTRVAVRFDGESRSASVRPGLLHVVEQPANDDSEDLVVEGFHWHVYSRHTLEAPTAPTPAERQARLTERPDAVLRTPISLVEWIIHKFDARGERCLLWWPGADRWIPYDGSADRDMLHLDIVQLAARAHNIYLVIYRAVSASAGPRFEVFAEGVTAVDCPEGGRHDDHEHDDHSDHGRP